jgi:hypothetical protein
VLSELHPTASPFASTNRLTMNDACLRREALEPRRFAKEGLTCQTALHRKSTASGATTVGASRLESHGRHGAALDAVRPRQQVAD